MNKPDAVVEIVYFNAGGGHANAMRALREGLAEHHPGWRVRPVDLQALLEPIDPIHRITQMLSQPLQRLLESIVPSVDFEPIQAQDVFNFAVKRGAMHGVHVMLPLLLAFIQHAAPRIEDILRQYWTRPDGERPDLVVSVVPNFNAVLFRALGTVLPAVPYVTIMTDLVDCPPHYWMEDQDQFLICGTRRSFDQAIATGFYDRRKIFEVSGMMLRKSFYALPKEPALTRPDLGLSLDRPVAFVMFGGNGALAASLAIVEQIEKIGRGIQSIVMCGNNRDLHDRLQGRDGCHAVSFVDNVADYLRLADVFIGKPGPGCLSEALHLGCPVIVERNADTMLQERPNADWISENGVGIVVEDFENEIGVAMPCILNDLSFYRRKIDECIPSNHATTQNCELLYNILNFKCSLM